METTSELISSVCKRHFSLPLTGHRYSATLHSSRTSPHRTEPTARTHCILARETGPGQVLLLLSILLFFLCDVCSGLVVFSPTPAERNLTTMMPAEAPTRGPSFNLFSEESWYWRNATIPYVFDRNLPLRLKRQSVKAMCAWMKQTDCVKFVERTNEKYYVRFQFNFMDSQCNSYVGRNQFDFLFYIPGREVGQPLALSFACNRGKIMHEIGHVLGLYHEHERWDRDRYLEVDNQFVKAAARSKFEKSVNRYWFDLPYDYGSIMHYALDAYSVNRVNNTLIPLTPYSGHIGQRKRLSHIDRHAINNLYWCSDRGANRNMLPDSPDFIKDGDWIILTPEGLQKERVTCTRANCSLSCCAGRLFKPGDVKKCPSNLITLQKASQNANNDAFIRVGDTVLLKWEQYRIQAQRGGIAGGPMLGPVNSQTMSCSASGDCSLTANCVSPSGCREQEFMVKAVGKSNGDHLKHEDVVFLARAVPGNANNSFYDFSCTRSGSCDLRPLCQGFFFPACQHLAARYHLYKY